MKNFSDKKGIAIFIAVIATSAIIIITLAIADISFKEQIITYSGKDSKVAFYAADSGLECALYHDIKKPNFFFATAPAPIQQGTVRCNNADINSTITIAGQEAKTVFSYNLSGTSESCAVVTMTKTGSGPNFSTKIDSRGYNNTCSTPNTPDPGPKNLERSLEVNY